MRLRLRVTSDAEREIRKAASWWRRHRPAAPSLFRDELARGFDLITTEPGLGAPCLDVELPGVRRLHLYRVHYYLYYRTVDDAAEVLGLWHTSRGEAPRL